MWTRVGIGWALVWAVVVTGCEDAPAALASEAPPVGPVANASRDADPVEAIPAPVEASPPLSGGTLAITPDGAVAVVSDPDTDRVLRVDLARREVTGTLALSPGDEPGRVVIDGGGRAHVALRGGGAVVTIDLDTFALRARRAVCPIPRGLAWDDAADLLHVACMGGELVTLPAAGGEAVRRVQLDRDLRDVVVQGNRLLVTRFRAAETLVVDERGFVTRRFLTPATGGNDAALAWRAVAAPGGGAWVLHQRARTAPVVLSAGYYEPLVRCPGTNGVVVPAVVRVRPPFEATVLPDVPDAPLAVDIAVSPSGDRVALAIPGAFGTTSFDAAQLVEVATSGQEECLRRTVPRQPPAGQVVAVAYTPSGALVAQTRAPASVVTTDGGAAIDLGGPRRDDPGHRLFHTNPTGMVTCASCHAEGEDDGRVWTFSPGGQRRTPYLRGGILGTEPFHWGGELRDFRALVQSVMVQGMRAPMPDDEGLAALMHWVDRLPRRPRLALDAASVARGDALFHDASVGCATCHGGPLFTNGATVDVFTGGAFQVPSLRGLAWRAPYMHQGCARTLRDRFGPCGGGDAHGRTSQLKPDAIDDLVAYLEGL